jgi:hypothetical protein
MSRVTTTIDADRIAEFAGLIDVPRSEPPDSFALHAPLELLARAILLERVPLETRPLAYERIQWLARKYDEADAKADPAPPPRVVVNEELVLSLAAAGHAPILTSLRSRVPAVPSTFGSRLVANELHRNPDWRFSWPLTRKRQGDRSDDLVERLAAPDSPGDPGSDFIYPMMRLTERSGLAAELLTEPLRGLEVAEARRILLRVAAHSMLQDDCAAAAYQWTHCLTLPQAVLVAAEHGADPDLAVAVAATYVLGFRAIKGRVRLDQAWTPGHDTFAGRVWWASDDELPTIVAGLASHAAIHPDAHLAKYTLACFDASEADPLGARLFLAAAAHLHDWWSTVSVDDPILHRWAEQGTTASYGNRTGA